MTFTQFIKEITTDQVDYWWNTIAPAVAPKEAEDSNWKYKLSKNNKSFPFKWVIRELANYYNINNGTIDFGSNNETRNSFCKRFDFEIDEDLVFDQSEYSRLKSFIEKLNDNQKETFQEFVNYTHSLISDTKIPPYKIRMATRNNEKEAMIILGMRATQAIGISSNEFYVSFIVNEEINTNEFAHLNIFTEQFKGIDQKKLINFTINHWNEIPQEILDSNRACFIEEYEMIKHTKLVVWNKGASTTNSALKNLIYNNSSINEYLKLDLSKIKTPTKLKPNTTTPTMINIPLNQILYGPPGTGKTYHTINKAIEITNPSFDLNQDRSIVKAEYNRLVNEGQIAFTTFHQSMSYEDFIEGIKPVIEEDEDGTKSVVYEVKNGIFKTIITYAQQKHLKDHSKQNFLNFDDAWDRLIQEANRGIEDNDLLKLAIQTPNKGLKIIDVTEKGNLKLKPIYSEEAKEYIVSYSRAEKLQAAFPDLSVVKNIDKEFRSVIGGSNSTAYWAVLNKINNKINSEKKSSNLIEVLPSKPYVLIIDEINRGNVSQIFGELITLIEESKRLGNKEELKVTLPYSKEEFGVPNNLYIIGTMNTADRSVEALDTALRRRFSFTEMLPNSAIIKTMNFRDYPRAVVMEKINQRIEVLLDRNYMLGHAYFMKENFKHSFENEIIPLLQEYFYNDYSKIGLVLGKGFVRAKAISLQNVTHVFADFDSIYDIDLIKTYELIPFNEINFEEALALLIQ